MQMHSGARRQCQNVVANSSCPGCGPNLVDKMRKCAGHLEDRTSMQEVWKATQDVQ